MKIERIVADGDLDGLFSAAILRRVWPRAKVRFSHPAEVRSGGVDDWIGADTAVLDLPFHPDCGLHIDHHLTNKPTAEQEEAVAAGGGCVVWREALSAARVCFDTFCEVVDLSDIAVWMTMVDKLDGGRISREEFLSENPIVWISRTIDAVDVDYCHALLDKVTGGCTPDALIEEDMVAARVAVARAEFGNLQRMLDGCTEIVDRLAVVRLEGKGIRTNGYLVTAHFGGACDACMIVHGHVDGRIGDGNRWPLSASFYSNSFVHEEGGIFDLTRLACAFDIDGGGHANACGCRIQPLSEEGAVEARAVTVGDIQRNIDVWLADWSSR